MAFTDNCDLYGAVHEQGVNRVIQHLMLQRPSMFNYATADVAGNKELWCEQVKYTRSSRYCHLYLLSAWIHRRWG
jgi:hypothetical protein